MNQPVERSAVLKALNAIKDPKSGQGLVEAGLVQGLVATEGRAGFMMEVTPADAQLYAGVRDEAEAALKALPSVATRPCTRPASTRPWPDFGSLIAFRALRNGSG